MSDGPLTEDQVAVSLASKLKALDLTEQERSLLHAVLQVAGEGEVQGFAPAWSAAKAAAASKLNFEITQDVTVNKAKTQSSFPPDGYIQQ